MGRPRKKGQLDLPEGLYRPGGPGRSWRIRHPLTRRFKSLGTTDEAKARKLHAILYPKFLEEKLQAQAEELHRQMAAIGTITSTATGDDGSLSVFAGEYLRKVPTLTSKRGKNLSDSQKNTYRLVLEHLIKDQEIGSRPLGDFGHVDEGPQLVRRYLSTSMNTPSWYNSRLGVLSRLFNHAVDAGAITRNPCDPIHALPTPVRDVYIETDAYVAITQQLESRSHPVYAHCCDLIYLLSARVGDALGLEESQIDDEKRTVLFQADKNDVWVEMEANDDLMTVINWFRAYKRQQGIISPKLCVHPRLRSTGAPSWLTVERAATMTAVDIAEALGISNVAWAKRVKRYGIAEALSMGSGKFACSRKLAGQSITVAQLRDRFNDAKEAAGYAESGYTLKDLRPKGLTDEALLQGKATNKGGWKEGSSMPNRYVKLPVPVRTRNNLTLLREKKG